MAYLSYIVTAVSLKKYVEIDKVMGLTLIYVDYVRSSDHISTDRNDCMVFYPALRVHRTWYVKTMPHKPLSPTCGPRRMSYCFIAPARKEQGVFGMLLGGYEFCSK